MRPGDRPAHSVRFVLVTAVVTALQLSDALLEGGQGVVARNVVVDSVPRHRHARRAVRRGHLMLASDMLLGDLDVLDGDVDVSHSLQLLSWVGPTARVFGSNSCRGMDR